MIEIGEIMKKKRKLKRNVLWILLCFVVLLLLIVIIKNIPTPKKIKETPKEEEKIKTEEDIKLEKLNHIHKKMDYFKKDFLDRYLTYQEQHPELETIQVIKNVNMHLDKDFYTDIEEALYPHTKEVLVNKHYALSEGYIPENLENIDTKYAIANMKMVHEARVAFEELSEAASKENLRILAMSSYRDYYYQRNLYNQYVNKDGVEKADTYSARAGHSEHQTGYATDVYNGKVPFTSFENTEEYIWMKEHAHEYGFILRYPKEKVHETGYQFESWHYRYVGLEIAKIIHEKNITLEEYYATKKD